MTGATGKPILECIGVERRFGGLVAVTGVDIKIERGEIFGLVGPQWQRENHAYQCDHWILPAK